MKISILYFSDKGELVAKKLKEEVSSAKNNVNYERCKSGSLDKWTKNHFTDDALIFIGSCGIAVRAIAPYIDSKMTDPAIVVIDELATYAIPILSGHVGGANSLANEIELLIGAKAIITTATDINNVFAIDSWAVSRNLNINNPSGIKLVSSSILSGEKLPIFSDCPLNNLPDCFYESNDKSGIAISPFRQENAMLVLIPNVVSVGIGCRKDTKFKDIETLFLNMLADLEIYRASIFSVSSIDLKAKEPGLLEFVNKHSFAFHTYTASDLEDVKGDFTSSDFVKQITGIDNVCERSALKSCGDEGTLIYKKHSYKGVTIAAALRKYEITF